MSRISCRTIALTSALIVLAGCGGAETASGTPKPGGSKPTPGVLSVSVSGVQQGDAGILFSIAPSPTSVDAASAGLYVRSHSANGETTVLVTGALSADLLHIAVPDTHTPPTVTVVEVGATDGAVHPGSMYTASVR